MKVLFIAMLATFVFALVIIYHDSQRTKAMNNLKMDDDIKIIICNGKVIRVTS